MDEKYFVAKIQYDLVDTDTGKVKKIKIGLKPDFFLPFH